jgi:hypothetical protein
MRAATDVGQYLVLTAFAASLALVLLCTLTWKWWHTIWGQTSVAISVALSVALFPGLLHRLAHINTGSLGFVVYYDASLALITAVEVWRAIAFLRAQWRRSPPGGDTEPEG